MKNKIAIISSTVIVGIILIVGMYVMLRGDFEYEVNEDNTVTITGYRGKDIEVVIPEKIGGKSVVIIGEGSFVSNEEITSVDIPESVEVIEECAFASCKKLTTVIGGEGIREFKRQSFGSCKALEDITFYEGLEVIEEMAFSVTGLTKINIPSTVKEIKYDAFGTCIKLKEVNIPESVEFIGKMAFDETAWFDSFTMEETLIVGDGILLKYSKNQETVMIPNGVKTISTRDWKNEVLQEIYVPRTTKRILEHMFGDHGEITIYIPSSVEQIGGFDNPEDTNISYNDMDKVTLVVEAGSYAEEYAKLKSEETGLKYRIVDEINYPVQ